jgi:uncharacterized membrane protein YfcA
LEVIGYALTLIMGISLGLLGGGGSILTVPILIYFFSTSAVTATAYSLFIVGLASAFGAFGKYREGVVNLPVGITFAIPGFFGVFLSRAYIIPALPEEILTVGTFVVSKDVFIMLIFAVMMIVAAASMIRGRKDSSDGKAGEQGALNYPLIGLEGLGVGALTGFVGAGGGFMIIPALVVLAKLPMKTAVGTSLLIIAFKSLLGFLGDVMVNPSIEWPFLLTLSAISVVGIVFGSALSKKVSEQKLKQAFGYFVLLMGTFILAQQLYS